MSGCTPATSATPGGGATQADFITISPLTRVSGQYRLSVAVEGGIASEAQLGLGSFQALELAAQGRDPLDAAQFMQRWSGICPVSQAIAASSALEQACEAPVVGSARALRNLMQASGIVLAHLAHFYHQALPDYMEGPDSAPFKPRYAHSDLRLGPDENAALARRALEAHEYIRLCNGMIAILGGRSPQLQGIVPGGVTKAPAKEALLAFLEGTRKLRAFVEDVYLPEVYRLAGTYKDNLFSFGQGYKNAICAGGLPLGDNRVQQVFKRGAYSGGKDAPMDARRIKTFLRYANFDTTGTGLGFRDGVTAPQPDKKDAYSFAKAARYDGLPFETGPLARMWVTNPGISPAGRQLARRHFGLTVNSFRDFGDLVAFSLMGRHIARAEEAFYVLGFMERWLQEAQQAENTWKALKVPENAEGLGLTESPQGMLLHYIKIEGGVIAKYQVISPDMWNASPKDDLGQRGVIEQALIGAPVPDLSNPVNLGRLARAFGV